MEELRSLLFDPPGDSWAWAAVRATMVFVVGVALLRVGSRRFPGQSTPFDLLLAVVLGSVLSRTINGDAAFVQTLAACGALVVAHWVFAGIAQRSHRFGVLIKGRECVLVCDGEIDREALELCQMSERDLVAALRLQGGTEDVSRVASARLERNGAISVLLRDR